MDPVEMIIWLSVATRLFPNLGCKMQFLESQVHCLWIHGLLRREYVKENTTSYFMGKKWPQLSWEQTKEY